MRTVLCYLFLLGALCASGCGKKDREQPVAEVTDLRSWELSPEELNGLTELAEAIAPHFADEHKVTTLRAMRDLQAIHFYRTEAEMAKALGDDLKNWEGRPKRAVTPLPGNAIHIVLQSDKLESAYVVYWEFARWYWTPDDYSELSNEKKRFFDTLSKAFAEECKKHTSVVRK